MNLISSPLQDGSLALARDLPFSDRMGGQPTLEPGPGPDSVKVAQKITGQARSGSS